MAKTPWMTSDTLVEAVKRKISIPLNQNTFTASEVLDFANEEMAISQVPAVLSFHSEYFVSFLTIPLVTNVNRYPVPDRAIGMRLRDLSYVDTNGNMSDMAKITPDDKAYFQRNLASNQSIFTYYMEGNDIVLTPQLVASPSGQLVASFFLRPNQLVPNDQAAIINCFIKTLTVDNSSASVGDTITITNYDSFSRPTPYVFTAVASSPSILEYEIGADSATTASNIVSAILASYVIHNASNGSPTATNVVSLCYDFLSTVFTTNNTDAYTISTDQGIEFDNVPANITEGSLVDFLQTKPGHRTYKYNVLVPRNAISGNIITFPESVMPTPVTTLGPVGSSVSSTLQVGDYVCSANECIIPQIPPDLHTGLAERTSARILSSIGDMQGLEMANQKIADIAKQEGSLISNRVEGSPSKIVNRHSPLRGGGMGPRRRF